MATNPSNQQSREKPLLSVRALSKQYVRGGLWRKRVTVAAANDVSFDLRSGKTLAIVGASGSGKSTVARCVTRLEQPDSGQIWIDGVDIAQLSSRELQPHRARIQMIFQDAVTAMNPRFSAEEIVEEPLRIHGTGRAERQHLCETLVNQVGLSPDWLKRPVMDFSGGQRQRLAIARALTLRPMLLVLDEALSGLDLPAQAQIANLLLDLQALHGLSYVLISHDLALVARLSDSIAIMSQGRIVESGNTQRIVSDPQALETKILLASARAAELKVALAAGASA